MCAAILIHRAVLTFDDGAGGGRQGEEEESAFHGKLPPGILPHGLPTVKEVQPAVTVAPSDKQPEEEKEKKGIIYSSLLFPLNIFTVK